MNRGGVNTSHQRSNNNYNQYRNDKRNPQNQGSYNNSSRGPGGNFNQQSQSHHQNQNQNAQRQNNDRKNTNSNDRSSNSNLNNAKKEVQPSQPSPAKSNSNNMVKDEKANNKGKGETLETTKNQPQEEMETAPPAVTTAEPVQPVNEKPTEKKFTGRCRLFVGNITSDITEDEFRKLFEPYGEVSEVYVNSYKGFGFIRLDYRHNAEAAKAALDGMSRKGRVLRIRFATHGAALKVKNLHPYVSNELLEESFKQFGDLERCIVIVDDRGKSTGEGIVEFMRKPGASSALRRIQEGVFLMGVDPRPIHVEPLEQKDEEDGMPEKFMQKTAEYTKEREKEPRFAPPGTFEYEFGMRWKQLEDLEKQRIEQVKKDTEEARLKLEDEMQNALFEYQADQIRQDLLRQQEELRGLEELKNSERQRRLQEMERRREQLDRSAEERRRADMMMNMRQQEIATRTAPHDERELRREQMMMEQRYGERMPDRMGERMGDRMGPGMDRMGPGNDRMGPGMDRMGPGMDRMGPGMDRMGPGMDRMGPGMDRMDRMGQGMDRMGHGMERMGPGMDRMGPGMDRMGPGMDRMGPGMDRMGSRPDRMGPGMERMSDRMGNGPQDGRGEREASSGPKPLMGNLPGIGDKSAGGASAGKDAATEGQMEEDINEEVSFQTDMTVEEKCEDTASMGSPRLRSPTRHNICDDDVESNHHTQQEYWKSNSDLRSGYSNDPSQEMSTPMSPGVGQDSRDSPGETWTHQHYSDFHDHSSNTPIMPCNKRTLSYRSLSEERTLSEETLLETNPVPFVRARSAEIFTSLPTAEWDMSDTSHVHPFETEYQSTSMSDNTPDIVLENETNVRKPSYCCTSTSSTQTCSYSTSSSSTTHSTTTPSSSDYHSYYSSENVDSYQSSKDYMSVSRTEPRSREVECYQSKSNEFSEVNIGDSNCEDNTNSFDEYRSSENVNKNFDPSNEDSKYSYTYNSINSSTNNEDHHPDDGSSSKTKKRLSSYKQHSNDELEDMEDDDPVSLPDVYQSYEEDIVAPHVHNANMMAALSMQSGPQSDTSDSQENSKASASTSEPQEPEKPWGSGVVEIQPPTCSNTETDTSTKTTVTEASSSTETDKSSSSSSVPQSTSQSTFKSSDENDNNDGAFRTGDQSFKTPAARQSAINSFMKGAKSSGNQSSFTGSPVIQGLPSQPGVMQSSTMHMAQLPGGTTIMRQQSMSSTGVAQQQTMVQQHALANGMQATQLVQQRTLTNNGQTMLVQQRTLTTGLGGVQQQTVVQQRVAQPPTVQVQPTHRSVTMRQHAMASQQAAQTANLMQRQRAVRLAQARVLGGPVLQAQHLSTRPTFIAQTAGGNPTLVQAGAAGQALVGAGLVRGPAPSMMQQLVRQRYLGGPVMPGRGGIQIVAGRPVRVKMTYSRENVTLENL